MGAGRRHGGVLERVERHNRVSVAGLRPDYTARTYNTATWRPSDNSVGNRVSFVTGLQEDFIEVTLFGAGVSGVLGEGGSIGVSLDSIVAVPPIAGTAQEPASNCVVQMVGANTVQVLGFHYLQAMESGSGSTNWFLVGGFKYGLKYAGRF